MSTVMDLGNLPIGTKIEKIEDGVVVYTLHTISLYNDYKYLLTDENGNQYSLTIKDLMWGHYKIHFQATTAMENKDTGESKKAYY